MRGETNIPGLYVAGDVDGGLPHSYLGGAIGMGSVIGEQAGVYSKNNDLQKIGGLGSWIRKQIKEFEVPLLRSRGLPTHQVEYKARRRLQHYLLPPKNPNYLNTAIWWMQRILNEDIPEIKALDFHDLVKVHEIKSILLVGEMMAKASLFRDESRWGYQHWRVDIPEKKKKWEGKWVVIRKNKKKMELLKRKSPSLKWNFKNYMDYSYPELSFDVGKPFKRSGKFANAPDDPWMKAHMEKEGMETPRRFLKREK